ncbi:MAG: TPM domain-containing protein [Proteobacteria bacterium]|nr:TPM domain-containing protein [Pseudomonadota bacterium]
MKILFLPLFLLLLFLTGCSNSDSKRTQTVIDRAGILSQQEQNSLQHYHTALLQDHDIDFRLILEDSNADREAFNLRANSLMEELATTTLSRQGRIILLLIDSGSDLTRLEISGDLEGIYTDAFSGYIQQQHMVYFFQEQRIQDGVLAASEMIYERARDASLGKGFQTPPLIALSTGGGATAEAGIGKPTTTPPSPPSSPILPSEKIHPGEDPRETLLAYQAAMAAGNKDPELEIFSDATRTMLREWTVTPVQMRNAAKGIQRCSAYPSQIFYNHEERLAVIRYPVQERQCHPWFFTEEGGKWRLDLKTMQQAIGFNQKNQYHFREDHSYSFAFTDLRFDRNGYPHK